MMNFLSHFGTFLSSERARFAWVYNSFRGLHNNSKGEIPRCLSDLVTDSSASPTGTALACQCGKMSSALLTRWVFVPPATFAASLIHSSPGRSPAFMLQGSSCQQLCQMAPLKVMGCPDRLAPPSAEAFGKETLPFLAPPLGCTRVFLPKG